MKIETTTWNPGRFLEAQTDVYETALAELRLGQKRGHWMWFIFPQITGLGRSIMAQRYSLSSLEEAHSYLAHPVLGPRLRECMQAVLDTGQSIPAIFPYPDDLKFHSCATLFAEASNGNALFAEVLQRFFEGRPDQETIRIFAEQNAKNPSN